MKNCHKSCPYRSDLTFRTGKFLCHAVDAFLHKELSNGPCILPQWIANKQKILAEVEALPEPEDTDANKP